MKCLRSAAIVAAILSAAALGAAPGPADLPQRVETKRADLAGAPGMEVISSMSEFKTGEEIPRHFHHGIESAYVVQGTLVQFPGQAPVRLETGTTSLNLRDVPHAGFRVVGAEPLRLFTVHIVDKGKPLYEWAK